MEEEMKGYWKYFVVLVTGALMNLAGGWIGKTTLGYLLFGAGLAIVIAGFVYLFLKKSYFKAGRLKVLILGLVLSLLLGSSITLLLNNSFSPGGMASNSNMLSQMSGGAAGFGQTGMGGFPQGSGRDFNSTGTGRTTSGTNTTTGVLPGNRAGSLVAVLLGWIFLASGGVLLLVAVIRFLTKKVNYQGARWKVLLLGLLVGGMISTSTALLLTRKTLPGNFAQMPQMAAQTNASGTMMAPPGMEQGGAGAATETVTPEPTRTPAPTSTPAPTATATLEVFENLVVCLNYDIQYGINIRAFPSDTARAVGSIPAAGCFTINGRNSQYPDWYRMAAGQNGMGNISISSDADENSLWVNGKNFDKSVDVLGKLPEIEVTTEK